MVYSPVVRTNRPRIRTAACALLLVMLAGCSAQKPATMVVWQKLDGSPATREELDVAGRACAAETRAAGHEGTGRFAHIEWSANMLDCMKRKGYERVEKPAP